MLHPAANVMTSRPPAASGQEVITNIDRLVEHSIQTVNDSGKSVFIDMRYKRDRGQYHIGPASGLRAADGCWVLTASCSRANSRRRSPGRVKRRWNSGSWNQPLKFSTPPLNCGSPAEMNTGPTPNRRHSRITRDRVRAAGPQPASRSDDPSNRLDEQRRRLDELVQELEEVSRQQLEHVSRLYKPADRSNRRRLAWHQFGF